MLYVFVNACVLPSRHDLKLRGRAADWNDGEAFDRGDCMTSSSIASTRAKNIWGLPALAGLAKFTDHDLVTDRRKRAAP